MNSLFRISSKMHLGFILMTKLAEDFPNRKTLKEIADAMQLSEGYLEEVAALLRKANLVIGHTGPKGGYELARDPQEISSEEIVIAIEGPMGLVDCHGSGQCPVEHLCSSKHLWDFLHETIATSLKKKSLAELIV